MAIIGNIPYFQTNPHGFTFQNTWESYLCSPQNIDLDEIGEISTFQQLHLDIELPGECSSTFGSTAGEFPTGFGGSADYGDHGIRDWWLGVVEYSQYSSTKNRSNLRPAETRTWWEFMWLPGQLNLPRWQRGISAAVSWIHWAGRTQCFVANGFLKSRHRKPGDGH